ncbi:cell division protein FtsN [Muribacter muris]|uniref:Cell division protein FtsN n=1 Tax=Muribacter muris TaxID=67855 RepID=A0A4Y9JXH7_9PAST|nr:cell division protein FtsN [Muribacter muris]MBF0785560.1 cell division protein FtsN [Muribacter muris]MBF0827125.1 cell division protein FtsN [Muribacter muris]TFV09175.1 cell division protein FtsN [Muribacter muris]
MPNRDYAARAKKNKKGTNRSLILAILILLLMMSGLGLWVLKENAPVQTIPTQTVAPSQPKSTLPSPPEEVYSYIRDLETREVPVDKNSKLAKLTKEQEQQLQRQKEEEQRKLQQVQAAQAQVQLNEQTKETASSETDAALAEELSLKKAKEKQLAEEKRQAELKKQQEAAKKAEQQAQVKAQTKATEPQKPKQEPAKVVASAAKPADIAKPAAGKYGLQCGAFKNKAQAENMQARLAMAGYNARINSNGEWNRVVIGPIGDRAATSAAQSNSRSVAECLIVGM